MTDKVLFQLRIRLILDVMFALLLLVYISYTKIFNETRKMFQKN